MSAVQEARISTLAKAVIAARDEFPDSTLAELYDPDFMPQKLARAHSDLDLAVDRLYRAKPFQGDRDRVEHLFGLYEKLVSPLTVAAKSAKKSRRA